ncbi:MAG TPA: hypothetical protein VKY85_07780 [Candidatus Angelobacter sp.]|nr:hypothetical protein [Candidatus Angelobacter sp.]
MPGKRTKRRTEARQPDPPSAFRRVELLTACTCAEGPRFPDGSIVPHVHPSMARKDEERRRGLEPKEAEDPKQMRIGEEGWDPAQYENQFGV